MVAMRGLRGTWLDPFGHDKLRATERALITEYSDALASAMRGLTTGNAAAVAQLAGLPDVVRGYGNVKLANVVKFREQLARAMSGLAGDGAQGAAR